MGAYQAETQSQILQRMANRIVARSALSDLNQTGGYYTLIAAVARAIERAQQGEIDLLNDTDLDNSTGNDLDEIGKIYGVTRVAAVYATSTVIFTRAGTTGTVNIPTGTQVRSPEATAGENLDYSTTAVGTILAGFTASAPVAIRADATGSKYNISAGSLAGTSGISSFVSKPSGVDGVYNPNAITNGRSAQTDDEYRKDIKAKIASLSRSTVLGLEGAPRGVYDSVSGKTVQWVGVFEDEFWHVYDPTEPQVTVYIDDGNGTAESTVVRVGQAVMVAVGGEDDIYLPESPIKSSATFALYVNTVLVPTANYYFNQQSGHIKLKASAYPDGLTAADIVTADYTVFTGLIALIQKIIDGDPLDRSTYPGYRGGGVRVSVLSPTIVAQTVTANITVLTNFTQATVIAAVKTAIQTYINNLSIGEDVIRAELIERIMGVTGVFNVQLSRPVADVVVSERQLARVSSSMITVT